MPYLWHHLNNQNESVNWQSRSELLLYKLYSQHFEQLNCWYMGWAWEYWK